MAIVNHQRNYKKRRDKKIMKKTTATLFFSVLLLLLLHFLILPISATCTAQSDSEQSADIKRSDFPRGFLFGAATSAYQIEGAYLEDGKSLSNWDVFTKINGHIEDGQNAEVADDHYHRYMEDIEIMHSLGLTAYRFSISWCRVLPRGRLGGVNEAAIAFYNSIINNLLSRGIEPFVTIHHQDCPQEFIDRFSGWLSPQMQEEFVYYAETCFESFADRVKYWTTINEPNILAVMSYEIGIFPPARCSPPFGNCVSGNSDVEPLIAAHNMLLAHAKAVDIYRKRYKSKRDGQMSITLNAFMYVPLTDDIRDKEAAERALAFNVAWTLDPLVFGEYPPEMRLYHGNELPTFSSHEKDLLRDSIDFIGVNSYGALYAKDCLHTTCSCAGTSCDKGYNRPIQGFVQTTGLRNGVPIGDPTGMPRFFVVPRAMEDIVDYLKKRYHNKHMFVTENGYATPRNDDDDYMYDVKRIHFHQSYLAHLARAISNGADVRGYFIWSLMDNFEWTNGYQVKFGLYHINRPTTLNRVPKLSTYWYRDFLSNYSSSDEGYKMSCAITAVASENKDVS